MTTLERQQLEAKLSAAFEQLHGYAASIGDSQARLKATSDMRYVNAINNVIPLYNAALQRYNDIARQLGQAESPSEFLVALASVGDGIERIAVSAGGVVTSTANAANTTLRIALVAVVVVALAYAFGGGSLGKLIPGK